MMNLRRSLDRALWRFGFREPLPRGVARRGFLLAGGTLLPGLVLLFAAGRAELCWFAAGLLVSILNFCALSRQIPRLLQVGWSGSTLFRLLFQTNFRLFLTGIFLYFCIVPLKASLFFLLTGLTVPLIDVTISALWHRPLFSPPLPNAPEAEPEATQEKREPE